MTATVIVNVALQAQKFPANTPEVASIRVAIMQGEGVIQTQDIAPTEPVSASFASVVPGDYTATAQSIGSDGGAIGSPMSAAFNVPLPDVDRAVPASVSVTLGA
jgi:hypothetical protein